MKTAKRLICFWGAIIMVLGIFAGCGKGSSSKIDIGGKTIPGEPMLSCVTRIVIDNDTFSRESEIELLVGFGFRATSTQRYYSTKDFDMVLSISAENFLIINAQDIESKSVYKDIIDNYLNSNFICAIKNDRYIPNYYQTFKLKLISDDDRILGGITIQAGIDKGEYGIDGYWVDLFYAANPEKIAFSAKSIEDAQKKLK